MMKLARKPAAPLLAAVLCLAAFGCGAPPDGPDTQASNRIVSLDGTCTEILFALSVGRDVVARDQSAYYPPEVKQLPSIGTAARTNMEAVLAMNPTLIVTVDHPMRQAQIQQLATVGVDACVTPYAKNIEEAKERIRLIAKAVGCGEKGESLIAGMERELAEVRDLVARRQSGGKPSPRVLLLLVGAGRASMLSKNSAPYGMVELAGGVHALEALHGVEPLTPEALIGAKPEVILVYRDDLEEAGGIDALLAMPGFDMTPAGQNRRVVALDHLLLGGWGPRVGIGAKDLYHALYEVSGPYLSDIH